MMLGNLRALVALLQLPFVAFTAQFALGVRPPHGDLAQAKMPAEPVRDGAYISHERDMGLPLIGPPCAWQGRMTDQLSTADFASEGQLQALLWHRVGIELQRNHCNTASQTCFAWHLGAFRNDNECAYVNILSINDRRCSHGAES